MLILYQSNANLAVNSLFPKVTHFRARNYASKGEENLVRSRPMIYLPLKFRDSVSSAESFVEPEFYCSVSTSSVINLKWTFITYLLSCQVFQFHL